MALSTRSKGANKGEGIMEKSDNLKQLTLPETMASNVEANAANSMNNSENRILAELEKLRQENREGHTQTMVSLSKLETTMKDLKNDMVQLEKRTTEAEDRISSTEDTTQRHERAIRYLLHREMDLTARQEDLQNRSRRNNLRIYRVAENSEGTDMIAFVKELLRTTLQLSPEVNLQIERAHRALAAKPKSQTAAPRSIIIKFLDFTVKDMILRQAWGQRQVLYEEKPIFFDHDYSPELQKRRSQVREAIKQLKLKNIRAKCIYPAQLKVLTDEGDKTYSSLAEATPMLTELGIHVRVDERERMEHELARFRWSTVGGKRTNTARLSSADARALFEDDA